MNQQQTLKALYEFTASQYDNLKSDWNKLPKHEKQRIPFALFTISVFATILEGYDNVEATKKP